MGASGSILINWPAVFLVCGTFSGLLVIGRILTLRSGPILANRILATVLGGMVLLVGTALVAFSSSSGIDPVRFRIVGGITLLYGPLIYLYILASIQREFRLGRRMWLHLIPPAAILVAVAGLSAAGIIPDREELIQAGMRPPIALRIFAGTLLLYEVVYLFLAARNLLRYRAFVRSNNSFSDDLHARWLQFLFALFLMPLLFVVFNLLVFSPLQGPPFPAVGGGLMLMILHGIQVFVPRVFSGFPEELQVEEEDLEVEKYQSSPLEESQKNSIHRQLLAYMEAEKPWLKDDLTLQQLAAGLGVNSKYLSQVINEMSGRHFLDFVNEYRVNLAREMLTGRTYQHYTIVAIAQEVGFRSRSAFYSAFKKFTGQTPTEYKNR